MSTIERVSALEILDSRGRPTVRAMCVLTGGARGTASVPSGSSTGTGEALERRDGDLRRYRGLGCRAAVGHVNGVLNGTLAQHPLADQGELDRALIEADGTANKGRLGANALLAVSLAFARAMAMERGVPLYQHFADMVGASARVLPRPAINLFSGGKHAGGQVAIQDVLVVPITARTIDETLSMTSDVYQAAAALAYHTYAMRALTADEGGLAPPFPSAEAMLGDAVDAIRAAGLEPGTEVVLAIDVAASHFYRDNRYHLDGAPLDSNGMIARLSDWLDHYPIVSVEDGLAEDDWEAWPELYRRVAGRALVLGDDLLCTNPGRIRRAVAAGAADALLLKVNQIGTLTEAAEAYRLARDAGWSVTMSARSGETEDDWLADLAVGWSGDYIKVGSIRQSERLSKYNRLLAIERDACLPLAPWPTGHRKRMRHSTVP